MYTYSAPKCGNANQIRVVLSFHSCSIVHIAGWRQWFLCDQVCVYIYCIASPVTIFTRIVAKALINQYIHPNKCKYMV